VKKYQLLAPALFVPFLLSQSHPTSAFENLCPYIGQQQERIADKLRVDRDSVPRIAATYCSNVGRKAYNAIGPDIARSTYLGPIEAVIWANSGDVISQPGGPPRITHESGFMYMIGPGGIANDVFFRWGPEIAGR
jgi:hypothetical protein